MSERIDTPVATHRPRILVMPDAPLADAHVAERIAAYLARESRPVLGLATGRTMVPVYAALRERFVQGRLSFAEAESFNLDEYCGLPAEDPSSFASYMRRHLFDHVDMAPGRYHLPDPQAPDAFEAQIARAGGIGLQLLGIGRNGHIGFNVPGAARDSRTRIVRLEESTRRANAGDFPQGAVLPTHAVTMGISTILEARSIVLLAIGAGKADSLARAFDGPVGPACPASFLQLHGDVTVVCDAAAASRLEETT